MAEWRLFEITANGDRWPEGSLTFWNHIGPLPGPADRTQRKTLLELDHLVVLAFDDGNMQVYIDMESHATP